MLKIWGRVNSVNVKKALWACEELGLKYERVDAGMEHGVTKTSEYLKMNPNALVPTIEDDGFVLWESHTIVRYLCAKHGAGTLWPTELRARADAERWMDWAFTFQRAMRDVFWGLIRTPAEERDLKAIEAGREQTAKLLPVLEQNLVHRKYVGGASFTTGFDAIRIEGSSDVALTRTTSLGGSGSKGSAPGNNSPCRIVIPLTFCTTVSKPRRDAHGPTWLNAHSET